MPSCYAKRAASVGQFVSLVWLSLAFVCTEMEGAVDGHIVPFRKRQTHVGIVLSGVVRFDKRSVHNRTDA